MDNLNFKININNEVISGVLSDTKVKDLRFYIIENGDKVLVVRLGKTVTSVNTEMEMVKSKILKDTRILDIYYLQESFKTIKKTIKKNQFEGLKSLNVIFSSIDFGDKWRDKKEIEKEIEYDEKTELENYIGVYKIRITKTGSYKMTYDSFGTLIVTESGITIETEIPSIDLLRSTHDKTSEFNTPSKGSFWCTVLSKSYLDGMMVNFNDSKSVGSFTTLMGKNTTTTIFRVVTD